MVGSTLEVLVEGAHPDTELLLSGRTRFQAPEVDGTVIINDQGVRNDSVDTDRGEADIPDFEVGKIYRVEITDVAGYDLIGKICSD